MGKMPRSGLPPAAPPSRSALACLWQLSPGVVAPWASGGELPVRSISLILMSLAVCVGLAGAARAAVVYSGGANPNWTDIQKYEWYVGYIARTSRICGAHTEAAILTRLARMSPCGSIGLSQMRGDSFLRNACLRITEDAREMVDGAERIEQHIEATYDCSDDSCFGQSLDDWQFHDSAIR